MRRRCLRLNRIKELELVQGTRRPLDGVVQMLGSHRLAPPKNKWTQEAGFSHAATSWHLRR
jgi:hypothetical protein